jgi:hypothetical protein
MTLRLTDVATLASNITSSGQQPVEFGRSTANELRACRIFARMERQAQV